MTISHERSSNERQLGSNISKGQLCEKKIINIDLISKQALRTYSCSCGSNS